MTNDSIYKSQKLSLTTADLILLSDSSLVQRQYCIKPSNIQNSAYQKNNNVERRKAIFIINSKTRCQDSLIKNDVKQHMKNILTYDSDFEFTINDFCAFLKSDQLLIRQFDMESTIDGIALAYVNIVERNKCFFFTFSFFGLSLDRICWLLFLSSWIISIADGLQCFFTPFKSLYQFLSIGET